NFTDATASNLPAKSDPEYLQGDHVQLVELTGDGRPELVIASASRVVSPTTGQTATTPALRIFANDGNGVFTAAPNALRAADGQDYLQCDGFVVGDLYGQGNREFVLVSKTAPNQSGPGARLLIRSGATLWISGSKGLPDPALSDNLRGADVAVLDVD